MNTNKVKQKILAIVLIIAGITAITLCEDATAGIMFTIIGICLLFTKRQVMEF